MFNNKWLSLSLSLLIFLTPIQSASAYTNMANCKTGVAKRNFGLCGTTGPVFFGMSAHQGIQNNVPSYSIGLGGAAFLFETDLYGFLKLGAALSGYIMQFTPGTDATAFAGTKLKVLSGTPAIYGGFNYGGAFFIMTVSTGILKYNTSRTVNVVNQIATARFEARQNSVRGRIGYAIPFGTLEVTPIGVIDNVNLRRGAYTETGAGAFNISRTNGEVSGSQTSYGVRFAEISEPDIFYPEIHFFSFSDGKSTRLKVISRFLDGIPPIVLEGDTPGAVGYNIGGSISTTIFGQGMYIIASYDYERREKSFNSHSVFLRIQARF